MTGGLKSLPTAWFWGSPVAFDTTLVSALTSTVYTYVCCTCTHMCVPIGHVFVFQVNRCVFHVNTLVCARGTFLASDDISEVL